MTQPHPPAGHGNPLGLAGEPLPRMGPCMAGRTVKKDEWPWDRPCKAAARTVLQVRSDDMPLDDEPALLPLCLWHRELLDAAGAVYDDEPPEQE